MNAVTHNKVMSYLAAYEDDAQRADQNENIELALGAVLLAMRNLANAIEAIAQAEQESKP